MGFRTKIAQQTGFGFDQIGYRADPFKTGSQPPRKFPMPPEEPLVRLISDKHIDCSIKVAEGPAVHLLWFEHGSLPEPIVLLGSDAMRALGAELKPPSQYLRAF